MREWRGIRISETTREQTMRVGDKGEERYKVKAGARISA